eukprot:1181371-Prorocentrum_minimum.AAC.1
MYQPQYTAKTLSNNAPSRRGPARHTGRNRRYRPPPPTTPLARTGYCLYASRLGIPVRLTQFLTTVHNGNCRLFVYPTVYPHRLFNKTENINRII